MVAGDAVKRWSARMGMNVMTGPYSMVKVRKETQKSPTACGLFMARRVFLKYAPMLCDVSGAGRVRPRQAMNAMGSVASGRKKGACQPSSPRMPPMAG